jgi:predicted nucleic acid-binding Zn ribbon protein
MTRNDRIGVDGSSKTASGTRYNTVQAHVASIRWHRTILAAERDTSKQSVNLSLSFSLDRTSNFCCILSIVLCVICSYAVPYSERNCNDLYGWVFQRSRGTDQRKRQLWAVTLFPCGKDYQPGHCVLKLRYETLERWQSQLSAHKKQKSNVYWKNWTILQ